MLAAMRAWQIVVCLGVVVSTLGCPSDPEGACTSRSDCPSGMECRDARCAAIRDVGVIDAPGLDALGADAPPLVCEPACTGTDTCIAGSCCERESTCGTSCCTGAQVCSFERCVSPGAACIDSDQCLASEYCEYEAVAPPPPDLECAGVPTPPSGRCLPRPPECDGSGTPGVTCIERCELTPSTVRFDAVVRHTWPDPFVATAPEYATDVMMTPIVVQLGDDNCDGIVDERDVPDIVFTTFASGAYSTTGTLRAVSVEEGRLVEAWHLDGVVAQLQLAGGDLHPSFGGEIIACGTDGSVIAVSATGTELWRRPSTSCWMPALADLDQDGDVEVIVEGGILDGETGALEHAYEGAFRSTFTVADLDGDSRLDVVTGFEAYRGDGTLLASTEGWLGTPDRVGLPAVADLDGDGRVEVVVVMAQTNEVGVWRYDAAMAGSALILRTPFDGAVDPGGVWAWTTGMGPVTAGDFDGDDHPDIAYTGFRGYVVLDGAHLADDSRPSTLTPDGVLLWSRPTREDNGSTGSALFDFDGDGRVEVLYNDTERLLILSAADGEEIASLCNTTGSVHEYPVVADVDGDGEADVIVVSNAFASPRTPPTPDGPTYRCQLGGTESIQSGLRVLSSPDGSWVRAPRIWNQHTYHVTNVDESGAIPRVEVSNWLVPGLNNFRQNLQPGTERAAPDAVVTVSCLLEGSVRVTVRNVGSALLADGVEVRLLDGATELARVATTLILAPAQQQAFDVSVGTTTPAGLRAEIVPSARVRQCRTDNDTASLTCLE